MPLQIVDANNEIKSKYFEKLKAKIRAELGNYVSRHCLNISIAPFDGHCLAFEFDLGYLSPIGSVDNRPWCSAYLLKKHAPKFEKAGFELCDITVAPNKNSRSKTKTVLVSFVMPIAQKHWN